MNSDEYDLLTECRPFHGKIDGVEFSLNYRSSIVQNLVQKVIRRLVSMGRLMGSSSRSIIGLASFKILSRKSFVALSPWAVAAKRATKITKDIFIFSSDINSCFPHQPDSPPINLFFDVHTLLA